MRRATTFLFLLLILTLSAAGNAHAVTEEVDQTILKEYTPAIWNKGLETAYVEPDPAKFRSFVVVERGGIPAERARYFITWSDYDYRGVVIHLSEDDKITTRRGSPYTYLKRGDVMAVAGIKYFNRTIYLKLISAEVYLPPNRIRDKRHSRITVMLGFKFPKSVIEDGDADAIISVMNQWLRPFSDLAEAKAYAGGMRDEQKYLTVEGGAEDAGDGVVAVPVAAAGAEAADSGKIDNLEDKIENARKELDEAQRELDSLKKQK